MLKRVEILQQETSVESKGVAMAHGGAAIAAAIANAVKASGVVVNVDEVQFQKILRKVDRPLVVYCESGVFSTKYYYVVSYKGFAFHTKSAAPIILPSGTEIVITKKLWMPQ